MVRTAFDKSIRRVVDDVLVLGSMVETALGNAVETLKNRDLRRARRIIEQDREINRRRFSIEADALAIMATQQPMAGDLRTLAAVLEIITELERIGDYAKGISKITLLLGTELPVKPLIDLPIMADKALDMLHRALDAFVRRDIELARAIPQEDDDVDALYNQVNRELITYIIADPAKLERANYLLWAAHNLERAADRVTNICERVVFTVTGEMDELDTHFDDFA